MQFWANLIRENKLFPVWFNKFFHSMFESHRCTKFFSIPCYLRQRSFHLFQNCELNWKNFWKSTKSQRTETKKLKLIFSLSNISLFFRQNQNMYKVLVLYRIRNPRNVCFVVDFGRDQTENKRRNKILGT